MAKRLKSLEHFTNTVFETQPRNKPVVNFQFISWINLFNGRACSKALRYEAEKAFSKGNLA
jgi:hypothetical protein